MERVLIILAIVALAIGNSYLILGQAGMEFLGGPDATTIMVGGMGLGIVALVLSVIFLIYNKTKKKPLKNLVIALLLSILALCTPFLTTLYLLLSD